MTLLSVPSVPKLSLASILVALTGAFCPCRAQTAERLPEQTPVPAGIPATDSLAKTSGTDTVIVPTGESAATQIPDSLAAKQPRKDTLVEIQHALRIGVDLAAPLMPLISGKDGESGWMIMADYRLRPRLYAAVDVGHSERKFNFSSMRADIDGWYAQAGVQHALLQGAFLQKNGKKEGLDILFIGVKLGYSKYHRHLYDATINNSYWGGQYSPDITDHPSALWIDLSLGISVCIWNELYLSMRGGYDIIVNSNDRNGIGALAVPGIGQVYNKSTAFSFAYGLSYRIPLYKREHRVRLRQQQDSPEQLRAIEEAEKKKNFTPAFTTTTDLLEE